MKTFVRSITVVLALFISYEINAQDLEHFSPLSLETRIQNASVIAEGKVISSQSFWDEAHRNIYTSNIVQVSRYLKGNCTGEHIEIITQGGVVELEMEVHSSGLKLGLGQTGIFFGIPHNVKGSGLRMTASTSFWVYGGPQGFIEYHVKDQQAFDLFTSYPSIETAVSNIVAITNKEQKLNAYNDIILVSKPSEILAVASVSGFSPTSITAGTSSVLTINGSGFNASRGSGYVEFRNSNNGGSGWMQPLPSDYVSWTDNQIQVRVPSTNTSGGTAGTGQVRVTNSDASTSTSASSLTITYAYINVAYALDGTNYYAYRPDHINDNGSGGYTIQYNTTLAANTNAVAAFGRAMDSWTCATGMNWTVGASTSATGGSSDGVNAISFSSSLNAGTLASTASRYSGCISGGDLVWWVYEIDMEYNSTFTWNYTSGNATAGQFDFESVSVHELGHAHQLTHVINSSRIMHYAIGAATTLRTLTTDDIAGGNQVMANSLIANACGGTSVMSMGTCLQTLPVELNYFTGTRASGNHLLTWETVMEKDFKEFQLQSSFDASEFKTMQTIAANGNPGVNKYSATNVRPAPGVHAYRLKMINDDGSFEFSDVVVLKEENSSGVKVSGNPIRNYFIITLPSRNSVTTIRMIDALGKQILNRTVLPTASNIVRIDCGNEIAAGMYFVEIIFDGQPYVHKLVKE